ncbi:unnamed protein product [Prunus brigantina]
MGTTSVPVFLPEERLPFGKQSGASPALPPCTPFGNSPVMQLTVEAELLAQITSLRQDMVKLQEHNNLLSSKVDETQQDQPHLPKKIYFDCRHRLNDREVGRQRSSIRVNARL